MTPKAAYITLALSVADIRRSIDFYRLLGMELMDVDGDHARPGFARLHSEGGDLILLPLETAFEGAKVPDPPFTWFMYLYTTELPALREYLVSNGIKCGEIKHPPYMKEGEIALVDPDGYPVFVGQWSEETHREWELERRKRIATYE